jgi:hypothetical protein
MKFILATVALAGLVGADPKPYVQDFEDAKIGSVPKGWTVLKTGEGEGSVWKVVEDKSAPKGAKVLAQVAESPNAVFNLCVADGTSFTDVEVYVAFKAVKGDDDQGGGVMWRYADEKNYYIARYNPREANYRLYKVVAGKRMQLANKDIKLPVGEWHTLAIRMKGSQIECLLDGKVHLEARDETFAKAGKVGLWTKADAHTYFDDFQAKELSK